VYNGNRRFVGVEASQNASETWHFIKQRGKMKKIWSLSKFLGQDLPVQPRTASIP
jgi:hypothetical protein